jgi:hypothetical protein
MHESECVCIGYIVRITYSCFYDECEKPRGRVAVILSVLQKRS